MGHCSLMLWNLPAGLSQRVHRALTQRLNRAMAEPARASMEDEGGARDREFTTSKGECRDQEKEP